MSQPPAPKKPSAKTTLLMALAAVGLCALLVLAGLFLPPAQ